MEYTKNAKLIGFFKALEFENLKAMHAVSICVFIYIYSSSCINSKCITCINNLMTIYFY